MAAPPRPFFSRLHRNDIMADEFDYTQMWPGTFAPSRSGDDDRGIYLLDSDATAKGPRRGGPLAFDETTRCLSDPGPSTHPRALPGGQIYPGPFGAGRISDRAGVRPSELREGFDSDRSLYIRGSPHVGYPGFRGQVSSSRSSRAAIDAVNWDNRPPHFSSETGNETAHLSVPPKPPTPPLGVYPRFNQVESFAPGPPSFDTIRVVLFFIVVALAVSWLVSERSARISEKRICREFRLALLAVRPTVPPVSPPLG